MIIISATEGMGVHMRNKIDESFFLSPYVLCAFLAHSIDAIKLVSLRDTPRLLIARIRDIRTFLNAIIGALLFFFVTFGYFIDSPCTAYNGTNECIFCYKDANNFADWEI